MKMKPIQFDTEAGFTLVETIVAMAIVAIGFAGVYSLVTISERSLLNTIDREKMSMQADQILEVIKNDITNISNYDGDMTVCSTGNMAIKHSRRKNEWCERFKDKLGSHRSNDFRKINITNKKDKNNNDIYIVTVDFAHNKGKNRVILKRIFNAQ